jgi:hypothetical protein
MYIFHLGLTNYSNKLSIQDLQKLQWALNNTKILLLNF